MFDFTFHFHIILIQYLMISGDNEQQSEQLQDIEGEDGS